MGKTGEEIQLSLTESFNKSLTSDDFFFLFHWDVNGFFSFRTKYLVSNVTLCFMALLRRGNDKVDSILLIQEFILYVGGQDYIPSSP